MQPQERNEFERRLAELLGIERWRVREYFNDLIAEQTGRVRHSAARITGIRWQRGAFNGSFIRDPNGTDVLPPGYEPPPAP